MSESCDGNCGCTCGGQQECPYSQVCGPICLAQIPALGQE